MKKYFLIFALLVQSLAQAQDRVAYKWVYTVHEDTKKYVPTTLRLFDHAMQ